MKKKTLQYVTVAAAMSLLFAGCSTPQQQPPAKPDEKQLPSTGSDTPAQPKKTPEPVTLHFYFPGDPPKDQQAVLDEFYNRTKDTLNTKLVFNWVPWDQLKEKIGLKLASGEQVDAVFDAQWNTMPQMISKGTYIQLDSYFNNDKYPGLKKAFPPEYINNNKFIDAKNEEHIYGIPFTRNYGAAGTLIIRKDLRVKYGLPEIKSVADLEVFFDEVLKNEKGMVPFGVKGSLASLGNWLEPYSKPSGYSAILAGDLLTKFAIKDGKVDVIFHGEDISKLPPPMNDKQNAYVNEITARKWQQKGYMEKDVISQKDDSGFFKSGKFAVIGGDTGSATLHRELKQAVPGAELEYVSLVPGVAEGKPGSLTTDFKAWNFSSIPVTSKNADRVMAFFEWLYADPQNHDLFEYGIQGKHWEPVGSDKFKIPAGADASKTYSFPGYVLTWNPSFVRYPDDFPESGLKIEQYTAKQESFVKSPIAGFTLNAEPIKSELAKVGPEFKKARTIAMLGLTDNYEGVYNEALEKMKKMGLETIRAEIQKQLEAFLAAQKK
ncbi:extracellular solute-binding protein [Paenibacillus puerhi]|uniref:extracellular solute-binding protein n=1 Tax=Paenibacillus puerhi TaxID=2692622 RepID=UPI001357A868|nr:extracellular solute-binding protein [Paenibacillus puerhi]